MTQHTRISRRDFFKLNAIIGSALAVSVAVPAVANANTATNSRTPSAVAVQPQTLAIRFGTPTDVAATWPGDVWSVDAKGVIHTFDRSRTEWRADADEGDFPEGSRFVLARWGRPSGPNQMLMVLGPARA